MWLWGISELQCLSLFTQISIFNVYIDFCFFDVWIIICFLMFPPFSVFSMLYRPLLFWMFCINTCFLMFTPISFISMFIYPPRFFQRLHQHLFLMCTPISFFLMLDQQLFASVSQKSKFSRQHLVCLSFGTNIRLCHRSALSAQTISQSSLNIVSGEFFVILGGLIK